MKKGVDAKAASMRENTHTVRKAFNLSAPESCIQKYGCSIGGFNRGTLFITQNYLCFKSKSGDKGNERIPFAKITSIDRVATGIKKKITVIDDKKEIALTDFQLNHMKEAFALITYLWQNPVTVHDKESIEAEEKRIAAAQAQAKEAGRQGDQQQQVQKRVQVDTAAGDALLRLAVETDQLQNDAIRTIHSQGEQLNRIESRLDNIEGNLARADHLLRGIESVGYYMFGGKGKKWQAKRQSTLETQTDDIKASADRFPVIELEILFKKADDSFVPGLLVLDEEKFRIINPEDDQLVDKNARYSYNTITEVKMRARHEHMDVWFESGKKDGKGRLRMMSSYLQVITNQLFLRSKKLGHTVQVSFEPGVQKFEYENPIVVRLPPASREKGSGFFKNQPRMAELLTDSPQETRDDMDRVDKQLDQVYELTRGIHHKANELNITLDEQNEQLDRIDGRVDNIITDTRDMNRRIDKQLK